VIDFNEDRLLNGGDRDRRIKRRFQIEQEVRYKMLYGQRIAETGTGKTRNISSGGVWFTTEQTLTPGMPVELSLNWPVLLNDSCPMKLMIYGCIIRSSEKGAAVAIEPWLAKDPTGENVGLRRCQLGLVDENHWLTLEPLTPEPLTLGRIGSRCRRNLMSAMVSARGASPNRHDG